MTHTLVTLRASGVAALVVALAGCSPAQGTAPQGDGFGVDPTPEIVFENGCIVPGEFDVVEFADAPSGFELLPQPDCVYAYPDSPGSGFTYVYLEATRADIEAALATDELWYPIDDTSWVDDRTNSTITIADLNSAPYGWSEGDVLVLGISPAN
jgi:hypothetical protein